MKYEYQQALNKLKLDRSKPINKLNLNPKLCDGVVQGNDFIKLFLPFLKIKVDSREQDEWIKNAAEYFGISTEVAVKNKKAHTENLKEGDITFSVQFGEKVYDYTNIVAYERKGSPSELTNNFRGDRTRLEREFARKVDKEYQKFVLVLEMGFNLLDLMDYKFQFYNKDGKLEEKSCGLTAFSTVLSWTQPNNYSFSVLQYDTQKKDKKEKLFARNKLFWLIIYDMFYFFRQEIRAEAEKI